ncbi:hypothetical protein MBRA1_001126 [Malassezia brasiliensis]|uniref:Condensation domain-containing protein n=1 Tax=Malassezia brasiliensis TaxID=1821822 RepID=A0AAF0DTH5_9BASI|nr:hypothetical protein MBRA1_001126 [Malassezia brasiliensis]
MYQERRSSTTGRADDMITGTLVRLPAGLDLNRFVELLCLAIMRLRFDFPILATTIELGRIPIPLLPSLVYRTTDYAGVKAWVKEAFVVHSPQTDEEKQQSLEERTDFIRKRLALEQLDVQKCAKVTHVVLSGRSNEAAILVYCAHAISDAKTELLVVRKAFEYIVEYLQAPNPVPESHPLHPSQLPWGEEVARLPPCLHELYGVDIDAFNRQKAIEHAGKIMRGYSLRLDEGRPFSEGLCDTHHTTVTLSEEESLSLYRAAKSKGWTITQAVDAARHMAYVEMRRGYLEKKHKEPIPEVLHTNFLMPMDGRTRFKGEWQGKEFAGNATSGFVTILPLRDPYFTPADAERRLYFWRKTRDLDQVRVFCKVTDKLAHMYREASEQLVEAMTGINPLLMAGNLLGPEYPPADLAPEGFSSVGVLERTLPNEFHLEGYNEPIQITEWFVGLTMSRHIFSLQFSMHVWSFRGKIHLSVIHTDHFSQEYTRKFLEVIKTTLLLFAEAYDPLAPEPSHFFDRCVCM